MNDEKSGATGFASARRSDNFSGGSAKEQLFESGRILFQIFCASDTPTRSLCDFISGLYQTFFLSKSVVCIDALIMQKSKR